MYNKMNGYAPFRSSGSRMYGMSSSLPSGMDTDFATHPMAGSSRRLLDIPPLGHSMGSGSGGAAGGLGHMHHLSASSTSSLTGTYNGMGGSGGTNLIVNYLPQDMTDRELYSLFRTMGPIETCRIMRDFKTNYSFGYGFINFVTEDGAQRALKCLNGVTVRNKRLKVSYARPAGDEIKETNLYVTNLPKTVTDELLDVIFGKYGLIVQKNILRDKITGKPRGVAFIRFNKREEAQEAIAALNNVIPEGGSQPLTVRVAEEHGKSKAHQMFGVPLSPMTMGMNSHMNMGSNANMMNSVMGYPSGGGGGGLHSGLHHHSNAMHRGRSRSRYANRPPY